MFLARRELWFSKGRFLLIGSIIVLISWLVFVLSGLGNGLSDLGAAAIRYSDMDIALFEEEAEFSLNKSTLSEDIIDEVVTLPGVEQVTGVGTSTGSILMGDSDEESGKKTTVYFIGINPDSFLEPDVSLGEGLTKSNVSQIIVDSSLMDEGYTVGDTVRLSGSGMELLIGGFADNQLLNHLPAVYLPLETLREIKYAVPGSDMGINKPINAIFVKGTDLDVESVGSKISGVEVGTKKDTLNGVPGYTAENGTISLMLWLLIFISAFVVAIFFYVLTTQKVHQFGVMKAIGASNGFVIKSVVSQVFLLSSISILIGIGLTYLTVLVLPDGMPFNLLPNMVVIYALVLLGTSMVGTLFSINSIIKIDPLTALRRAE